MQISKSKAMAYHTCPLKFRFVYIDKLPRAPPGPALENGTKVHNFSEIFFDKCKIVNNELILNLPKELTSDMINIAEFEHKRFIYLKNKNRLDLFTPPFLEIHLEDKDLGLHGYIDRIEQNCDGTLTLMELKTGKYYSTVKLELDFYRLLCDKNNINISSHAVIYSSAGKVKHIKFTNYDEIKLIINNLKQAIETDNFEPKQNKYCGWCEFKDLCKFGVCNGV